MLKTRLISAFIMMPLVVLGVLRLDTPVFAGIVAAILCAAAWEWSRLIPLQSMVARSVYVAAAAFGMWVLWDAGQERVLVPLLVLACGWWVCALAWLTRPQFCSSHEAGCRILRLLTGLLVMLPCWAALVALHRSGEQGPQLTLALLVMIWLADSGAYFSGRRFGRHKLAPAVSPGKTREGVYGGLVASLLFALVAGWWLSRSAQWTATYAAVAMLAMLFSVVGDLLESLMKRQSGIKDSGSLIPGHGGVLDRIDSLMAAAPVFLGGYLWLGL